MKDTHRTEGAVVREFSSAMNKDIEAAERIRRLIGAKPRRCWLNAWRAVTQLSELADARYVEGWIRLPSGLAIEHGWIEQRGTIIDPTLPTHSAVKGYLPALHLNRVGAMRAAGEFGGVFPFWYRYHDHEIARRYKHAETAASALAHCRSVKLRFGLSDSQDQAVNATRCNDRSTD